MIRPAYRSPFPWLGALLALYLVVPVAALVLHLGSPAGMGFTAPGLGAAVAVSVLSASVATGLVGIFGVPLAFALAQARGRLAEAIGVAVQLPLAIPPLMSGILLLYLVGPYAPIGSVLGISDTFAGIVVAQSFVSAPFLVIGARSAFAAVDPELMETAATLGLGQVERFFKMAIPIAGAGIRAGLLLTWLRAFGEFGATVIVAYHPYSLPVFTYVQFSSTGLDGTVAPTLIAVVSAIGVLAVAAWRPGRRQPALPSVEAAPRPEPAPPGLLSFALDLRLGAFHLVATHSARTRRLAILGPSGAGKTTALRALAGLLGPEAGVVRLGDADLGALAPERRQVAYVPQRGGLIPHLVVWEQMTVNRGTNPAVAAYWLDRFGLGGLEGRYPSRLSGGERERVALARALSGPGRLLLLDEPFASLDTPIRRRLRRALRDLQTETGIPSVLVTHDPEEAALLADEILVIEDGKVLQAGPTADVFRRPVSPRVAELLGIENLHSGTLVDPETVRSGALDVRVARQDLAVGSPVRWFASPAAVNLDPTGPYRGRVLEVVNLGVNWLVTVELEAVVLVSLDTHPATLGTECRVRIDPEAVQVAPQVSSG